jgi:uncharacterized membrane protein YbhN (UPF0104 family)
MRTFPSPGASDRVVRSSATALAGVVVGVVSLVAATRVAHGPLPVAVGHLGRLSPLPLALAAVSAVLVPSATAAAWRSGLSAVGETLTYRQAWACYGLGSLANTFLPGKLGEAARIEAFARRLDHPRRRWLAGGVSATVAFCQSAVFAVLLTLGAAGGALPAWAVGPAVGLPALLWLGRVVFVRRRAGARVECLRAATTLSLSAWARLLAWIAAGTFARLLLAAAILNALSAPRPLTGAVVAIVAQALGRAVPFAPGGAGVPAAVMAIGLSRAGIDGATAAAAALSFHAFETGAAIVFGGSGWLVARLVPGVDTQSAGGPDGLPERGPAVAAAAAAS